MNDFTKYVLSTRHLLDFAHMKNLFKDLSINERTDQASEYKCVPLDPEKNINNNGQLQIDLTSGTVLSEILEERDAMRKESIGIKKPQSKGNKVEQIIGYVLAGLCGFLLLFIGGYYAYSYTKSRSAAAGAAPAAIPVEISSWIKYGLTALGAVTIGLVTGVSLSANK